MFEKVIEYVDFNDEKKKTTACFHLSKTELRELELDTPGGLAQYIQRIAGEEDSRKLYQLFRKAILTAYGERTDDNSAFIKRRNGVKLAEAFEQTAAYDQLITEFFDNPESLTEFFVQIMPSEFQKAAREAIAKGEVAIGQ